MMKVLYVCDEQTISKYSVTFDKAKLKRSIQNILNKNLEEYYYRETIVSTNSTIYSHIQSSYDLVCHLSRILLESEMIDLSELKLLMNSYNSMMRTPQTFMEISEVLSSGEYELEEVFQLKEVLTFIKVASRLGVLEQSNNGKDLLTIATSNMQVLNNLPNQENIISTNQKTISK